MIYPYVCFNNCSSIHAILTSILGSCGGEIELSNSHTSEMIKTPGYGKGGYGTKNECTWIISVHNS